MINLAEYSKQIRELSDDYFYRRISSDEYHARRKLILDELDSIFNGLTKNEADSFVTSDEAVD